MIVDSGFAASAPQRNTLAARQSSQIKERIDVEGDDGENEGTDYLGLLI